jgi:hypothetical protein
MCGVVLLLAACSESESRTPLLLVAVDGATWDVIDPLLARGELPNIGALVDRGMRGPLLSMQPHVSPAVWTTIVTGTFPRSHGILGFTYPYTEETSARSVTSDLRKDPALWNVASAYGRSVGIVGWYVSHPAEVVDGLMISDKLTGGPGSAYPEHLGRLVAVIAGAVESPAGKRALFERMFPWDYDPDDALDTDNPLAGVTQIVKGRVDSVCVRDETVRQLSVESLSTRPFDLFACYFRIVDHASHATWKAYDDSEFDSPAGETEKAMLGDVIPEAYRVIDDAIGDLLEAYGGDVNIVVVSDHGFGSARTGVRMADAKGIVLTGHHRPDGIFLAAGPDIAAGEIDGLTTLEIAPLLVALLDVPMSEELPGRLEERVLRPGLLDERPVRRVPRWDVAWEAIEGADLATDTQGAADEEATLESLRALGYIGETSEAAAGGAGGREFWTSAHNYRVACLTGELSYALLRGDESEARALLELVRVRDPDMLEDLRSHVLDDITDMEASLGLSAGALVSSDLLRTAGLAD